MGSRFVLNRKFHLRSPLFIALGSLLCAMLAGACTAGRGDCYDLTDFLDPGYEAAVVTQTLADDRIAGCQGEWAMLFVPFGVRDGISVDSPAVPGRAPPWLFVRRLLSFDCSGGFDPDDYLSCVDAWVAEVRPSP